MEPGRVGDVNHVELFAGGCLGALAHQRLLGHRTLLYVERDEYCQRIIRARIRDGSLHDAPIWDDVRTLRSDNPECGEFLDAVRACRPLVVSGGFPCQPFSAAGKCKADADERNLWPDTLRVIDELRPDYAFLENVPGLLSCMDNDPTDPRRYFGTVLGDLAEIGFDARWTVLSAADVGANHRRARLWILAYANADGFSGCEELHGDTQDRREVQRGNDADGFRDDVPDAASVRRERRMRREESSEPEEERQLLVAQGHGASVDDSNSVRRLPSQDEVRSGRHAALDASWWQTEPDVGRVVDGSSTRMDRVGRLRALGNGQVGACVYAAWRELMG